MRALILLACKRIGELSPQRERDPLLVKLRAELRKARVIAREYKEGKKNAAESDIGS